jgi:hypothetical protein
MVPKPKTPGEQASERTSACVSEPAQPATPGLGIREAK